MSSELPTPRRILLAFEDTQQVQKLLAEAVALAAERRAELAALLVEDENLVRLAALPFASEVLRGSGLERRLDQPTLVRQLGRRAERMRRLLEQAASARQVRTTWSVVRRQVALGTIEASGSAEVILMAARTSMSLATESPGRQGSGPVCVYFDGSEAAERALSLAQQLAAQQGVATVVVAPAAAPKIVESLRSGAASDPGGDQSLRVLTLAGEGLDQIAALASAEGARTLVLPMPLYEDAAATGDLPEADATMMIALVR